MRLFILSRVRLTDLAAAPASFRPGPGDVVAYFREAQDLDGGGAAALARLGATATWAEAEIAPDEPPAIERAAAAACFGWFQGRDGGDPTVADGLSLGRALSARFYVDFNVYYLLRAGVAIGRLLRRWREAEAVVSDLRDGSFIYCDHPEWPESMAWRSALALLAARAGLPVIDLPAADWAKSGVSGVFRRPETPQPAATWAGALRGLFSPPPRGGDGGPPWVFVSALHGVARVAEALARSGRVRAATDRPGVAGTTFVDLQRIWAVPGPALRRAARATARAAEETAALWAAAAQTPLRYDGIDLGPTAGWLLDRLRLRHLPVLTAQAAQYHWLFSRLRPAAMVASADYHIQTMAAAAWGARNGAPVYFVEHSVMVQPCSFYAGADADAGLVYLAESPAHAPAYGMGLKRRGLSTTVRPGACAPLPEMMAARGLLPDPPTRRALCLGYNSYSPHAIDRTPFYDRYVVELVAAARDLAADGISLTYRPHPAERPEYLIDLLTDLGAAGLIEIDRTPAFREALPGFDAVVANAGTCYYQALFAGWPTIFFEPSGMPERWIGLAAEPESGRPMARTAPELTALIRAVYEPESPVRRFAEFYRQPAAERYFGPSPEKADRILADIILGDLFPSANPG